MSFANVNWLAVLVCVVASMVVGFIWYHPAVFFKPWWAGLGKTKGPDNPNPVIYLYTAIAAAVQATFLAVLLASMPETGLMAGLKGGFMIWLGFIAPTNLVNKLFAGYNWKVWLIEAGGHLVNMLVFGAILALFG